MNRKLIASALVLGLAMTTPGASAATLDAKTKAELLYIVEEEKLARDVYAQLASISRKFQNINRSEQSHLGWVQDLLKNYGLKDPTLNSKPGIYKSKELTALYKKIMSTAKNSYSDAIAAGVLIEKTDIADLEKLLAITKASDVTNVANQLLNGSKNHLTAFSR